MYFPLSSFTHVNYDHSHINTNIVTTTWFIIISSLHASSSPCPLFSFCFVTTPTSPSRRKRSLTPLVITTINHFTMFLIHHRSTTVQDHIYQRTKTRPLAFFAPNLSPSLPNHFHTHVKYHHWTIFFIHASIQIRGALNFLLLSGIHTQTDERQALFFNFLYMHGRKKLKNRMPFPSQSLGCITISWPISWAINA